MLLIGIDEAGYGPRIGPLCHGFCAIRCPKPADGSIPDLWRSLKPSVMRHPARRGAITVDDSKKVYQSGVGLELLRKSVSAFLDCCPAASTDSELYQRLLPEADRFSIEEDQWGRPPVMVESIEVPLPTDCVKPSKVSRPRGRPVLPLNEMLAASGMSVISIGARAMSARHYNKALETSGNKADVNWSVIVAELQRLLALASDDEDVYAVIDRQGGRKFYASRINHLFGGAMAWVEHETPHQSIYKVDEPRRTLRVAFLVNADGQTLPVALGSMAAKLARELCMQRLNAFFKSHSPELKPTAGYYGDANRFLHETRIIREKLAIDNAALIRTK